MTDRLNLDTPILDAVLHALQDPTRTDFEIRSLDVMQNREDWLLRLKQEIAGVKCGACGRTFNVNRCPECAGLSRDARAEGYKADAAAWRERAIKAEAELAGTGTRPAGAPARELAEAIVRDLFVNGAGQQAARLVLFDHHGRDLGGWGREPARDRIETALQAAASRPLEEPRPQAIEALADAAHVAWSGWMRYLFKKCRDWANGDLTIPNEWRERWQRQIDTPYAELREDEKESDRVEARKFLAALSASGPREEPPTLATTKNNEDFARGQTPGNQ